MAADRQWLMRILRHVILRRRPPLLPGTALQSSDG